jgi:hypothetical protein
VITHNEDVDAMDELLAEVKAARRADNARKRHIARIKELLIQVRRENPKVGPADLERMIDVFYDRATISRFTAPALREHAGSPAEPTAS